VVVPCAVAAVTNSVVANTEKIDILIWHCAQKVGLRLGTTLRASECSYVLALLLCTKAVFGWVGR
jgi:hypothetical protein